MRAVLVLALFASLPTFAQITVTLNSLDLSTNWDLAMRAYAQGSRSPHTLQTIALGLRTEPHRYSYWTISRSTDNIRWSRTRDPVVVAALRDGVLARYMGESVGDLGETRVPMLHVLGDIPTRESVEALRTIEAQSSDPHVSEIARHKRLALQEKNANLRDPLYQRVCAGFLDLFRKN